jgi:hypothetical protein
LLQAQRQSLSQNKNIKTPLLAAEAFRFKVQIREAESPAFLRA